jgi:hypothetical protein
MFEMELAVVDFGGSFVVYVQEVPTIRQSDLLGFSVRHRLKPFAQ